MDKRTLKKRVEALELVVSKLVTQHNLDMVDKLGTEAALKLWDDKQKKA